MLLLTVGLLLHATPVLSDADLKVVERLASRAGVPRGALESLSTDVTGDGAPDVVLLTRTADRLVLFVAEGPVSSSGRWWRVDLHHGPGPGELCAPASAVRVQVEDHGVVAQALDCPTEPGAACPTPQGRALRVEVSPAAGGRSPRGPGAQTRCPAVHVFFDGSDLRFWAGVARADVPLAPAFQPARLRHRVDPCPPPSPRPRPTRSES